MIKSVFDAINPRIVELGYEIVDIESHMEFNENHITIYVDKVPEGISLDDCEKIHYEVEGIIDALDPTEGKPYVLEISSPGLDRPFNTHRDFERNYGKDVEIKLYAPLKGKKVYEGKLKEHAVGYVIINDGKEDIKIESTRIAVARPAIKFE